MLYVHFIRPMSLNTKRFMTSPTCSIIVLGLLAFFTASDVVKAETAKQPNIVLILADDLGDADLGCTGADVHQTPNLDAFARQSQRFTNAYSSHPTCSPSRSGILTGKYPARLGIVSHGKPGDVQGGDGTFVPASEYTLAEALSDAGYVTCHIGKWHVGKEGETGPKEQGFQYDIASNNFCCAGSFFYPYKDKNPKLTEQQVANSAVPDLEDRGPGDHLTECLGDEAAKFIARHKREGGDKPFFLNLWHYSVHTPIQAEGDKVKKYKGLIKSDSHHQNPRYAGLVEHLDDAAGRVLRALKENNLEENTIVIFFSDNGGEVRNGVTNNFPLRNGKVSQYQGGIKVPMFVRWPGVTTAGASCDVPVIGHDLYPTILKMAGTTGKAEQNAHVDGRDLTTLIEDPTATLPRDELHWLRYPVVFHYRNQWEQTELGPAGSVIKGDWKLIQFFATPQGVKESFELFNLADDPGEQTNLASAMPEKVEELKQAMTNWRKEVSAPPYEMAYEAYSKME